MSKILLTIPYWAGDKQRALELTKFIADLEPSKSELADITFIPRFDATEPDANTMALVNHKFHATVHRSTARGIGWPNGCNKIALGTFLWASQMAQRGDWPYKALAIVESDAIPMRKDWIERLSEQWDEASDGKPLAVAGDIVNLPKLPDHVNANALYCTQPDFLSALTAQIMRCPINMGWDYYCRTWLKAVGWAQIGIRSVWRMKTFPPIQWDIEQERGTVLHHGVKDMSLLMLARKKLL